MPCSVTGSLVGAGGRSKTARSNRRWNGNMHHQIIFSCCVILSSLASSVLSQTTPSTTSSNAYCFRFTWLGPEYDASADIAGATCTDLLKTYTDTPCNRPLIATRNGYLPDTVKLWNEYAADPSDIACRLTAGNVCVKYIHRYNNQCALELVIVGGGMNLNITYTCSKVTIVNEGATTSGCYKQKLDGYETEVCACRSRIGQMPCNSASTNRVSLLAVIVAFSGFLLIIGRLIKGQTFT